MTDSATERRSRRFTGTTQIALDNKTFPSIDPTTNRFNPNQGYQYDKNGNLISDAEGRSFVFNGENKQEQISKDGKLVADYDYNGEGQRVRKRTYDANGFLQDTTVFVYSAGKLVAEYTTAAPPENPTTRYTATDMLGSPRVITDSQGNVISRRDFKPFGEEITSNTGERTITAKYGAADNLRQKFTTYQRDEETGLDFAEARMYENRHGRFTAVDPLLASGKSANPQTFNRFVYVVNNPLILTDPGGLQAGVHKGAVFQSPDGRRYNSAPPPNEQGWKRYQGPVIVFVGNGGYWWEMRSDGWRRLGKFEGSPVENEAAVPDLVEAPTDVPISNIIPKQGIEFIDGNNLSEEDRTSIADTNSSLLSSQQCRESFVQSKLRNPFHQRLYIGDVTQLTNGSSAQSLGLTQQGLENARQGYYENVTGLNAITSSNNQVWKGLNNTQITIDDNPRMFVNPPNFFGERSVWSSLPTWLFGSWTSREISIHERQHGAGNPGGRLPWTWYGRHDLYWSNPVHDRIMDACR